MTTPTHAADARKPQSLVVGVELARLLSGVAVFALVFVAIGFSIHRYAVRDTGLNFAGPAFGFCMLVLLAGAFVAAFAVRAASRTLQDDTGSRDLLFGLGAAGGVILAIVAIRLFVGHEPVYAWIGVAWFVLTVVSLALMSTREASAWLEGRAPALNALRWIRGNVITFIGVLVMAFLYIPNLVVAAMSFNHEVGKHTTYQWYSFSFTNWSHICAPSQMCSSVVPRLCIGALATEVATLFGTQAL